jgi:hypothetical protein
MISGSDTTTEISKKRPFINAALNWNEFLDEVDLISTKKFKECSEVVVVDSPIPLAIPLPIPIGVAKKRKPDEEIVYEGVEKRAKVATKPNQQHRKRSMHEDGTILEDSTNNVVTKKQKLVTQLRRESQPGKRKRCDAGGEDNGCSRSPIRRKNENDLIGEFDEDPCLRQYSEYNHWKLQLPSLDDVLDSLMKKSEVVDDMDIVDTVDNVDNVDTVDIVNMNGNDCDK